MMTFGEHVFLYCERGTSTELLAEPLNALSNGAFLLAGLVGLQLVLWRPKEERTADHFLLPVLVLFIGLGSLSFHLYADQGTALADVVPIAVFMLVYLGFALNRFLGVPPGVTVLLVIGFTAIMALVSQVQCSENAIGFFAPEAQGVKPCLNGSVFYLPALGAMIVIGLLLHERGHKAAPWVLWAAAIFAVSLALRSVDLSLCDKVLIDGRKVGTHFAWHVLNALALFLLLRASLEAGRSAGAEASLVPRLSESVPAKIEAAPPPDATPTPPKAAEALASSSEEAAKESEPADGDKPKAEEEKPKAFFPA
jgi:Ceramidase